MTVYDEYVKGRQPSDQGAPNGIKEEEAPKAEGAEATA